MAAKASLTSAGSGAIGGYMPFSARLMASALISSRVRSWGKAEVAERKATIIVDIEMYCIFLSPKRKGDSAGDACGRQAKAALGMTRHVVLRYALRLALQFSAGGGVIRGVVTFFGRPGMAAPSAFDLRAQLQGLLKAAQLER